MDTFLNFRFVVLLGIMSCDFRACFCRVVEEASARTVDTKYGQIKGTLLKFSDENLKPVEVYRSLQYASTLGTQMRFMPPTSPLERWKFIRFVTSYRYACPQPIFKEEQARKYLPKGEMERRKKIAPSVMLQNEDCLDLNIYVPTGKNFLA